jgi:hypothetical protein
MEKTREFCNNVAVAHCGCVETTRLKRCVLHIENIIAQCRMLPVEEQDIERFLGGLGLEVKVNVCTNLLEVGGDLYLKWLRTKEDAGNVMKIADLCRTLWSHVTDADFKSNYEHFRVLLECRYGRIRSRDDKNVGYRVAMRTIQCEVKNFIDSYPLDRRIALRGAVQAGLRSEKDCMTTLLSELKQCGV